MTITNETKRKMYEAANAVCGKSYLLDDNTVVTKYSKEWQEMSKIERIAHTIGFYDSNSQALKIFQKGEI